MNFNDEDVNGKLFSWRFHPQRYITKENALDYYHLYSYVDELADSISGIVETPSFNQFLLESCQLLANSLDLIHQGYFDAAFYSVRQAGEVILIESPNTRISKRWSPRGKRTVSAACTELATIGKAIKGCCAICLITGWLGKQWAANCTTSSSNTLANLCGKAQGEWLCRRDKARELRWPGDCGVCLGEWAESSLCLDSSPIASNSTSTQWRPFPQYR